MFFSVLTLRRRKEEREVGRIEESGRMSSPSLVFFLLSLFLTPLKGNLLY
jgi:hypothetical protein